MRLGGQAGWLYAQGTGTAIAVGARLSEAVMHKARAFFFVCAGLWLLLPFAAPSRADVVFHEDFNGPILDPAKWSVNPGNGTLAFADGQMTLAAPCNGQFPYVVTTQNPFPTEGDFVLTVGFRYVDVQWGGNGFGSNDPAFGVWQDMCCGPLRMAFGGTTVWLSSFPHPDLRYHVYKWEYVGGTYSATIDGEPVGSSTSAYRPTQFFFGHPPYRYCPWTTQETDFMDIQVPHTTVAMSQTWGHIKSLYR